MKKRLKRSAPVLILLFAILFYGANVYFRPPESKEKKPTRLAIHVWCTATPAQTILEFKPKFEQLFPQYTVELQTVAWGSLQEKTLWAVAANSNVPDLILGSSEWTGGLANNGALDPLDEYLPPEFFDQYIRTALQTYQYPHIKRDDPDYRGPMRQYGIPLDLDMMLFFYRTDIVQPVMDHLGMASFPTSWEDFQRLGQSTYTPRTLRGYSQNLLYLDPEDPVPIRMAFLPASGGKLFSEDLTHAVFDSPQAIAAFSYVNQLIDTNAAKEWNRVTQGDPIELLRSERIAGYIAGPWFTRILEQRVPEQAGKWRVAMFPQRSPEYYSTGLGGSCLAMPYNAGNKEGAIELARFLASEEFAITYFRRVGSPPPLREVWNNPLLDQPMPYFGDQRVFKVVREAIDDSRPLQLLPNAQVMKQHVRWAMNEIVTRDANPTETLKQAVRLSNEALDHGH